MQYYTHYEENTGKILGFYADEIHGDKIPTPNIAITEKEWQDAVSNQQARKVNRETLKIVETLPPAPTRAECLTGIRYKRNELLKETDWTQMPDSPLTSEQRAVWKIYRQLLRDFPENCNPYNPDWPTKPQN